MDKTVPDWAIDEEDAPPDWATEHVAAVPDWAEQDDDGPASLRKEKEALAAEPPMTTFGGFKRELAERASQIPAGAAQVVSGTSRTIAAFADALDRNFLDLTPGDPTLQERALTRVGNAVDAAAQKLPQPTERDLGHDVMQGVGQMGAMLATGAGGRAIGLSKAAIPIAGTLAGFGMEFDDAFRQSGERGDSPDVRFAKSLGYATVSALIENKFGAGRILRRYFPDAKTAVQKLTAKGISKELAGNFVAGAFEEGTQQLAENLIVEGAKEPLKDVGHSALVGSLVQGVTALPSAGVAEGGREIASVPRPPDDALPPVEEPKATPNIELTDSDGRPVTAVTDGRLKPGLPTPAVTVETDPQRMAREQREASAALGQLKAEEAAQRAKALDELRPAIQTKDGTVIEGTPDQSHNELLDQQGENKNLLTVTGTKGFTRGDGTFITREEAKGLLGESEPLQTERLKEIRAARKPKEVTNNGTPQEEGQGRQVLTSPSQPATVEPRHLDAAREMAAAEEGPDIFDVIDRATAGPVKFSGTAMAEYLAAAKALLKSKVGSFQQRGLALRRMSDTEGRPANQVLEDMRQESPKYEHWTEDDLAAAMLAVAATRLNRLDQNRPEILAAAQRLANEEAGATTYPQTATGDPDWSVHDQAATPPGGLYQKTLDLLDKGIAATKTDIKDLLGGTNEVWTGIPVWGTKAILNGALQVMRAVLVRTRDLAAAISAGLAHLKSLNLPGFNEDEARVWLEGNIKERKFNAQLEAAVGEGQLSEEMFSTVENQLYQVRGQESVIETQSRAIELAGGPMAAVQRWKELSNGVPADAQVALGMLLIRQLGVMERAATARGETQLARDIQIAGQEFYDNVFADVGTELGRGVSMFQAFLALSPRMKFLWGRNRIERTRQAATTLIAPDVKASGDAMATINAQGIDTATAAPDVQQAATDATTDALQKQAETPGTELRNAIRKEVLDELVKAGLMTTREAEIVVLHMDGGTGTLTEKLQSAGYGDAATRAKRILEQLGIKMKEVTTRKIKPRSQYARKQAREAAARRRQKEKENRESWVRQARSIPDRETEAAAKKLVDEAAAAGKAGDRPALQLFYQRLTRQLKALFPEGPAKAGTPSDDMALVREVLTNPEKYAEVWQQTATEVRAKFGLEGMADVNRTLGALTPEAILETGLANQVDRLLSQAMTETQISMSRVIREHYTRQDATGRSLADKLAQDSGLPAATAQKLAEAVRRRFAATVQKAKEAALRRLLAPIRQRDLQRPGLAQRIIEATNAGQLSEKQYWDVVKERLALPEWSKATSDDIERRVNELETIPEGQTDRRHAALQSMLTALDRASGYNMLDLVQSFFITNLMFGLATHKANTIGNALNTIGSAAAEGAQLLFELRPLDALTAMEAVFRGRRQTAGNIGGALTTGQTPAMRSLKAEPGHVLETTQFGRKGGVPMKGDTRLQNVTKAVLESRLASVLNLWKANGRALAAEDLLFFTPAYQAKLAILTTRLYRQWGMTGRNARQKAAEVLGFGQAATEAAQQQAVREGFTGPALWRRVAEILEANVPQALRDTAKDYALRVTLNNKPYGGLGVVASMIQQAKRSDNAALRTAATAVAPIINIPVNWFNESLNYSPWGFVRLMRGRAYDKQAKNITPEQWRDLKAEVASKAALGTMLLAGLALKLWPDKDDKDQAAVALYGSGPMSPADREGWKARGNIPYSIRVGGKSYSYALSPMAVPLSVVANYMDRWRDAELYKVPTAGRTLKNLAMLAGYSLAQAGATLLDQSFMLGISDLMETLREPNPERQANKLAQTFARAGTSVVIPQELRAIDKRLDPRVYHAQDAGAALVEAIPFVRREGLPALNGLGQEVTWPPSKRFSSELNPDPVVKLLAGLGAWPSVPDRHEKYTLLAGREASDEEYAKYVKTAGDNAHRALAAVADDPQKLMAVYAAAHEQIPLSFLVDLAREPDTQERLRMIQRAAIADIVSQSRKLARKQMGWER